MSNSLQCTCDRSPTADTLLNVHTTDPNTMEVMGMEEGPTNVTDVMPHATGVDVHSDPLTPHKPGAHNSEGAR